MLTVRSCRERHKRSLCILYGELWGCLSSTYSLASCEPGDHEHSFDAKGGFRMGNCGLLKIEICGRGAIAIYT